jgi:uncharacterized protein (DUF983 family)
MGSSKWTGRRFTAILRQRCPVCLQGPMFSYLFTTRTTCPVCGHKFEREPGFFQGAMYVSYTLGVFIFALLALFAELVLVPRVGIFRGLGVAVVVYMFLVPLIFRYSRVIWAHFNIGTLVR